MSIGVMKDSKLQRRNLHVSQKLGWSWNLLCFNLMGCAKKVSKLINRPVVSLLDTRMGGT
jgi:hypothetical protein